MKAFARSPVAVAIAGSLLGGLALGLGGWLVWLAVTAVWTGAIWWMGKTKSVRPSPPVPVVEPSVLSGDLIDEVTGLPNQAGLSAWLSETATSHDEQILLLLVASVDSYAELEKTRGPAVAQAVVKDMAQRLTSTVGKDGLAARPRDGEFVAVKKYAAAAISEAAEVDAGRLAELLQRPVEIPTGVVWVGGSVGAAFGSAADSEKVLGRARKAAEQATRLGRGHFHVDVTSGT